MRVAGEAAWAAAETSVLSLFVPESVLQGGVDQLTSRVGKLGNEVPGMRQKCNRNVEDVLLARDALQGHLDSTASQLVRACNALMAGLERLQQHLGRSASSYFRLE